MSSSHVKKNYDVVVVGSIFMDLICYANRLPKPGETITGNDFQTGFGGKGANQVVAAQRLGAKTAFVGKVGDDANGDSYYNNLKAEGVDLQCLKIESKIATGVASIMVGANNGQNMIIIVPGANSLIDSNYVQTHGEALIQQTKVLLCQMEIPIESTFQALKLAKKHSTLSILNVAPAIKEIPKEMFNLADILCVNETEAEIICGVENVEDIKQAKIAIQKLVNDFGCNNVIITLGSQGALLWDKVDYHYEKAPEITNVVDTTGAGDCFLGILAYCLANGDSLISAMKRAVKNASESVKKKGTQSSFAHSLL